MPPTYAGSGTMFVADFNGDGKPDILSGDGTLQLGAGNGSFTTGTPVTGGALAVVDFTGNGKADVLEQGTTTLLVLLVDEKLAVEDSHHICLTVTGQVSSRNCRQARTAVGHDGCRNACYTLPAGCGLNCSPSAPAHHSNRGNERCDPTSPGLQQRQFSRPS